MMSFSKEILRQIKPLRGALQFFRSVTGALQCAGYVVGYEKTVHRLSLKSDKTSRRSVVISVRCYTPYNFIVEYNAHVSYLTAGYNGLVYIDDYLFFGHEYLTANHVRLPMVHALPVYLFKLIVRIFAKKSYQRFRFSSDIHPENNECLNSPLSESSLKLVESSMTRFYQSIQDVDFLSNEKDFEHVRKILSDSVHWNYQIAINLASECDIGFMSHGFYVTWGPFYDTFIKKGMAVVTYSGDGFVNGAINLSNTMPAADKLLPKSWEVALDQFSRVDVENSVAQIMNARVEGKATDNKTFNVTGNDPTGAMYQKYSDFLVKFEGKIVSVFPNVMWDHAVVSDQWNILFSSPSQWLRRIVTLAIENKTQGFIIRCHPAEAHMMGVRKGVNAYLGHFFGVADIENLLIIGSQDRINSYDIVKHSNLVTYYNGTIGSEAAWLGVPILPAASSSLVEALSLQMPADCSEYERRLLSLEGLDCAELGDRLERYIYYYFKLNSTKCDFLDDNQRYLAKYSVVQCPNFYTRLISLSNYDV